MASTAWLPLGPSSDRNCSERAVRTASPPKKRPATLTTIKRRGPSENTE
jgi:hypothetical protein